MQPLAKKLPLIVLLFVWIVGCLLFLVTAQMDLMSGVRAYVAGHAAWSRGRKDAVEHLRRYAHSHAECDYEGFLQTIAVPLGDHRARLELEKPDPDADVVRAGFVAGRNDPDDVAAMATIFRRFRHMHWTADAVTIWTRGDDLILTLQGLGEELHEKLRSDRATPERVDAILEKVSHLNDRIQLLEDALSQVLGEGARSLKSLLLLLTCLAAGLLLSAGAFFSLALLRHLRASEERYRSLFENANDLIYSHDLAGNITSINPAAEYITGYSQEEARQLNIADILIPEHLECARQMIARKVADGGATVYELDVVAKDGRRIPLEVSTRVIVEHGRPVGVQGIARDISERKRAEQALSASRLRLEEEARVSAALARAGRELISAVEMPGVSDRLCRITADALGCSASQTLLWQAGEDAYVEIASCGAVSGGARVPREVLSMLFARRDSDHTVAMVGDLGEGQLGMALRQGKEIIGLQLASARDGAAFSPEQRRIAHGLAHVGAMALANARLVTELERASRVKSEFLSTMSHELRTPVNVMLGYAEMARDAAAPIDRDECVARIEAACRDLLELIESTLEIGKIEANCDVVRLETVDLSGFWMTLGQACARLPRRPEVAFQWSDAVPDASLVTDPRKLTVIVRNLVGNALKFTERGWVRADVGLQADATVISVADSGIGIRPEDQDSIFEMYRQVDGSDGRRFGGAGLGLYIVRRFVKQLGGSIALDSAPERGSTFTITLPHAAAVTTGRAA